MFLWACMCYLWFLSDRYKCTCSLCPGRCLRFGRVGSSTRLCWSHTGGPCIRVDSHRWRWPRRPDTRRNDRGSTRTHWCPAHSEHHQILQKYIWKARFRMLEVTLVSYAKRLANHNTGNLHMDLFTEWVSFLHIQYVRLPQCFWCGK